MKKKERRTCRDMLRTTASRDEEIKQNSLRRRSGDPFDGQLPLMKLSRVAVCGSSCSSGPGSVLGVSMGVGVGQQHEHGPPSLCPLQNAFWLCQNHL